MNRLNMNTIGGFIKALRSERGFSLGELANLSGVGKTTIYDLESNKAVPKVETLINILRALRN